VAKESDGAKKKMKSLLTVLYCTTVAKLWQEARSSKIAPQERLQKPLRKGFRLQASRSEEDTHTPSREDRKLLLGLGGLRSQEPLL
jgi:hypothetical protein